jgi:hypothetical protein
VLTEEGRHSGNLPGRVLGRVERPIG